MQKYEVTDCDLMPIPEGGDSPMQVYLASDVDSLLRLLAPYARRAIDQIASMAGNDAAAHWALLEIERAAHLNSESQP